jgi:hypothetical protein
MRSKLHLCIICLVVMLCATSAVAAGWRFPVGLAYINGFSDVQDRYEKNVQAEGYSTSSTTAIPVGLQLQPYYQFDNGIGIGATLGPAMFIFGDRSFTNIPVGVDVRYMILPGTDISPFVRVGVKKHFASGDYVKSSSIGAYGGIGVEFFRKSRVSMGLELIADSSSIEFDKKTKSGGRVVNSTENIQPSKFLICIYSAF